MTLPDIKTTSLSAKKVFVRADFDVPLSESKHIEDDTRLEAVLPTLHYLLDQQSSVILAGHLGRPKGKVDPLFSLEPVAAWYQQKLGLLPLQKTKIGEFDGWQLSDKLFLLENLRFGQGEEKNDAEFAKKLASLAQVYVNDAFAMCHRKHASVVGIASLLPHFAGIHLQKEVAELSKAIENPDRPLVVIIGGKKVETKQPLVEKMHHIADYVLVGGKIAGEVGAFIKTQHEKLEGRKSALIVADLNAEGSTITGNSVENFLQIIQLAKTIVWNGPLGLIHEDDITKDGGEATKQVAEGIAASGAYSIVGGGDTTEFLKKIGLDTKFNFVSTGGGAMLSFLSGEVLPGLEALK